MAFCDQHGVLTTKLEFLISEAKDGKAQRAEIIKGLMELREDVIVLKTEAASTARVWSIGIGIITMAVSVYGKSLFG